MNFYKIALIAIFSLVIIILVRQLKNEFANVLLVGVSVVVLSIICDELFDVVYAMHSLGESAGVSSEAINCIIKVVGIGYLAEFTNNICVDFNCKSIGDKVLLAGKVAILSCALPIVNQLFKLLVGFGL